MEERRIRSSAIWKQFPNAEATLKQSQKWDKLYFASFVGVPTGIAVMLLGIRYNSLFWPGILLTLVSWAFSAFALKKFRLYNGVANQIDVQLLNLADALGFTVKCLANSLPEKIKETGCKKLKARLEWFEYGRKSAEEDFLTIRSLPANLRKVGEEVALRELRAQVVSIRKLGLALVEFQLAQSWEIDAMLWKINEDLEKLERLQRVPA